MRNGPVVSISSDSTDAPERVSVMSRCLVVGGGRAEDVGAKLLPEHPRYLLNSPTLRRAKRAALSHPLRDKGGSDADGFGQRALAPGDSNGAFECRLVHSSDFSDAKRSKQQQRLSNSTNGRSSIANMGQPAQSKTAESERIAAAIRASGMKASAVATAVGVAPSVLSQWSSGNRPVPADKAVPLSQALGVSPSDVSSQYRDVEQTQRAAGLLRPLDNSPVDVERVQRISDDVQALHMMLGVLVSVMVRHRPAEASDAAASLRRALPPQLKDLPLLRRLAETLEARP